MVPRAVLKSAVAVAILAACSDNSTGPTLTPSPPPPSHVYVADFGTGAVLVFAAPLTDSSLPVDTIAIPGTPIGVAVDDSGNLAVSETPHWLLTFARPLSSASVPLDSARTDPYYGFMAFGPDKKLYLGPQGPHVLVFTPPITGASVPDTIKDSLHTSSGIAFDRTRRLYVSDPYAGGIHVYDPPYTGAPAFTIAAIGSIDGIALDAAGRLFQSDYLHGKIFIFSPPLSASSLPADSIVTGLNAPHGIAIGGDGRLYVANNGDTNVVVFNPPFSHSSSPAAVVYGGGGLGPYGIAVGR